MTREADVTKMTLSDLLDEVRFSQDATQTVAARDEVKRRVNAAESLREALYQQHRFAAPPK
jgi:hypothetical protein